MKKEEEIYEARFQKHLSEPLAHLHNQCVRGREK